MAKVTVDLARTRRGPSFKKAVYHAERRGILIASKWPGPRTGEPTPRQQVMRTWFKKAQLLIKSGAAQQLVVAELATRGTPWLPRDLITSAMAGRLFAITVPGDRTYYPMAARQDVSASLDILGENKGDVLVRQNELWTALAPGLPGQVLGARGAGQSPVWTTIGPGDLETMLSSSNHASTFTAALGLQGNVLHPVLQLTIHAIYADWTWVAGGVYHPFICRISGTNIDEVLFRGGGFVAPVSGINTMYWQIDPPVVILPGQEYGICYYRSDVPGATNLTFTTGTLGMFGFPGDNLQDIMTAANNNPQANDTIVHGFASLQKAINCVYTI